jgi:type I restriction enzyme, S subunit
MKVPLKWKEAEFGEILTRKPEYGANSPAVPFILGQTPRLLRITDIDSSGRLLDEPKVGIAPDAAKGCEVADGDILIARTGATVGKSVFLRNLSYPAAFAGYLIRFSVDESKASKNFINQYLNSPRYWQWVGTMQRAGAQPNINSQEYCSLLVPLPPLAEQRKIADILGAWDEALEKLDALIAAQERRKQALMQQLLTGKLRLPKCNGRWTTRALGELVEPVARPVGKPNTAFLAAGVRSHGKGVFLKPAFEPGEIALDELFQVKKDDLIVNITFAWEGAAAIVPPEADGALVSHRFPTFRVRESEAALSFLRHCILTKRFVFDCGLASPGGAGRNRVLSKAAFLQIELKVPSATEQEDIGFILDGAAAELRLLRQQRTTLDRQKRGLMQRLLTGRTRVKIP